MKTRRTIRSIKKIYRARVKNSSCRGQKTRDCRKKTGCKKTRKGMRRSYCRKSRNTHV